MKNLSRVVAIAGSFLTIIQLLMLIGARLGIVSLPDYLLFAPFVIFMVACAWLIVAIVATAIRR